MPEGLVDCCTAVVPVRTFLGPSPLQQGVIAIISFLKTSVCIWTCINEQHCQESDSWHCDRQQLFFVTSILTATCHDDASGL